MNATGYGIMMPSMDELRLEEPEIIHQGGRSGVRLKASAPSIHMMKIDAHRGLAIVGGEKQTEELVASLLQEFEEGPLKLWQSNIFGKKSARAGERGPAGKTLEHAHARRRKMQETLERVINEAVPALYASCCKKNEHNPCSGRVCA